MAQPCHQPWTTPFKAVMLEKNKLPSGLGHCILGLLGYSSLVFTLTDTIVHMVVCCICYLSALRIQLKLLESSYWYIFSHMQNWPWIGICFHPFQLVRVPVRRPCALLYSYHVGHLSKRQINIEGHTWLARLICRCCITTWANMLIIKCLSNCLRPYYEPFDTSLPFD